MPLLVARRSPADGTPGARMRPPSCSCTRRTQRSFAFGATTTVNFTALDRCRSSPVAGTPGRTTMRVVSLTARLSVRAMTGAPSPTTSLSQAGSPGMECRRRTTTTPARDFAEPGTEHNDDAVSADDEDTDKREPQP
jgi:hypothetical protein